MMHTKTTFEKQKLNIVLLSTLAVILILLCSSMTGYCANRATLDEITSNCTGFVNAINGATEEDKQVLSDLLDTIPPALKTVLVKSGCTFYVAPDGDQLLQSSKLPEGVCAAGMTYGPAYYGIIKNGIGTYRRIANTKIVINSKHNNIHTLCHEIGHAIDFLYEGGLTTIPATEKIRLNIASSKEEWGQVYEASHPALMACNVPVVWVNIYNAQEAFAECTALYLTNMAPELKGIIPGAHDYIGRVLNSVIVDYNAVPEVATATTGQALENAA